MGRFINKNIILTIVLAAMPVSAICADNVEMQLKHLKLKQGNSKLLGVALQAGKDRALLCNYCHGTDGNSVEPHIPNLAGQNPKYLLFQFENFANGKRQDFVMNELASSLTPDERINIVLYYSSMPVKNRLPDHPELVSMGERLYQRLCFACHGRDGHGNEELPRLAGQPGEYLRKTLTNFRNNTSRRKDSVMSGVIGKYSEEDIRAVASYITTMK